MTTRREFLVGCGTSLVLAGPWISAGRAWASPDPAGRFAAGIGKATWKGLLNQSFWLYQGAHSGLRLTLVAVTEKPGIPGAVTKLDQFTLTFAGKKTEPVAEGTYEMMQAVAGNVVLHLQPVGQDARGAYYRSDFSLLA